MPEGDTLYRTATVLREFLQGRQVTAARGRADGAALGRVVGSRVDRVEAQGKHLLIGFDNGTTLHTHLRMHGSWHRYREGERWQRSPSRAVAVIEVPGGVAVCFDAPTVELLDTRALALHPALKALGPDLLAPQPDLDAAVGRLAAPARADRTIGEALLDQTALAGLGNVYRSELLFIEKVDPFLRVAEVAPEVLERLVATGARLLRANANDPSRQTVPDALGAQPGAMGTVGPRGPKSRLWAYGRVGRPCRRCGSLIRSTTLGTDLPRRLYWCPDCQRAGAGAQLAAPAASKS
jgi:endonuclease-8